MTTEQQILEQAGFTKEDGREYIKVDIDLMLAMRIYEVDSNKWTAEGYDARTGETVVHITNSEFGVMFYRLCVDSGVQSKEF